MDYLSILRDEYTNLRAEICQSIAQQHQIMIGGYGLAAAAAGYIVGAENPEYRALLVVPVILLATMCLWAVECNRMVRASYYIAEVLWDKMLTCVNQLSEDNRRGWETWIRIQHGNEGGFRRRQAVLQMIVALYIPMILTIAVTVFAVVAAQTSDLFRLMALLVLGIESVLWLFVFRHVRSITDLGAVRPTSMK